MFLRYLKSQVEKPYRMLYDLTAIDERTRNNKADQPKSDFTVVYQLLSFDRNEYIRLKVALEGDYPSIQTVTDIWPCANWYEREIWDMFGIKCAGPSESEADTDAAVVAGTSASKGTSGPCDRDGAFYSS